MLVGIVSKNGNLLLNIPVKGDGTIDDKEVAILEKIAAWMEVNKESIFDTRQWNHYGEGPASESVKTADNKSFNEGKIKLSAKDIRYNQNGKILYATLLGIPSDNICLKSLGKNKNKDKIKSIQILGSKEKLSWKQYADSLVIIKPKIIPNDIAVVFKIK